jgi:hypothetical protein
MLFDDADFSQCSISSIGLRMFLKKYLFKQIGKVKLKEIHEFDQNQTAYYFAKIILPNCEARYYSMANCIYSELQFHGVKEANRIFEDFKKSYPESEYTLKLQSMINQKADLSIGSTAPDFTLPDVNGKKVSLSDFSKKWVFLFINSDEIGEVLINEVNVVKKIKEKVQKDRFEAIWVITGNDKSNIKEQIDKCKSLGTILINPGWEDKQMQKYKDMLPFQWLLLSPGRKIEGDAHLMYEDNSINQLINTINQENKNYKTSSISLNFLLWSLGIISGIFVLIAVAYRRRMTLIHKREIMKRAKLDLELKAIRAQLNPHFIFNSLSSIQHLVNENRVDEANRYLSSFAGLMRKVLHQSDKEMVPLENELDTIRQYLELEALRFSFKFDIEVDPDIDIFNIEIPPLVLQPFVENAVIHGIAGMQDKGEVHICVIKNTGQIIITVEDNGIGYNNKVGDLKNNSGGKGLSLTRKRMEIIKQSFANNMNFEIIDLLIQNKSGTTVKISFDIEK